jgi:hypothetical protein
MIWSLSTVVVEAADTDLMESRRLWKAELEFADPGMGEPIDGLDTLELAMADGGRLQKQGKDLVNALSEARPVAFRETASGSQEPSSRFCGKPPVSVSGREFQAWRSMAVGEI